MLAPASTCLSRVTFTFLLGCGFSVESVSIHNRACYKTGSLNVATAEPHARRGHLHLKVGASPFCPIMLAGLLELLGDMIFPTAMSSLTNVPSPKNTLLHSGHYSQPASNGDPS
ncbi:hypothetical protein B0J12DRAFT_700288 [Macrophomina phaseolina]|uniref:Secreted protein n=1 Tax=Macrophomina phaseolina TaxID=35725 RepID=A0ABQ8G8W5_9PEZI|nr:hypothetical protein B0J12DRAFT_700288 [Macrophomina phaseolina]